MSNIEEFELYLKAKQEKENLLQQEKDNLLIAQKNGFETYRDFEYFGNKSLSRDPRFSLCKVYYGRCQAYLLDVVNACINYVRTGSCYNRNRSGNTFILTVYGINELQDARNNGNEFVINYMNKMNLDLDSLLVQISSQEEGVKLLRAK